MGNPRWHMKSKIKGKFVDFAVCNGSRDNRLTSDCTKVTCKSCKRMYKILEFLHGTA